jgi:abhydrolase domain-containing protein 6
MKILSILLVIFFSLLTFITILFYCAFPVFSSDLASNLRAEAAHLKSNKIKIGGSYMHYYEGGSVTKKDTIVLLHGWVDSKKGFLKLAKYLSENYYLIIPDLPGQGENQKNYKFDYTFENQALLITKLLNKLNINNYHLVGVSSGGVVSLYIGSLEPNQVKSLTLVNTPYLKFKNTNFFNTFSKRVKTKSELHEILNIAFYQRPQLSKPIECMLIKQINSELDFVNTTIIPKINDNQIENFVNSLINVDIPTLILHSTHDNLININNAAGYEKVLPFSTYGTIKNTGHYPQYENPSKLASCISDQVNSTELQVNGTPY